MIMIIQEWDEEDEQEELTDHDILALVNRLGSEGDECNGAGTGLGLVKTERLSHSQRVKAMKAALAHIEQQWEQLPPASHYRSAGATSSRGREPKLGP
jgi:hypothetical protein